MRFAVRHRTTYRYEQDVSHSRHALHLTPRATPFQSVESARIDVSVPPAERGARTDVFGNRVEWLAIDDQHDRLEVVGESHVTVALPPERDANASAPWEEVRAQLERAATPEARAATPFLFDTPYTAFTTNIPAYALESFTPGRPILAAAADLMTRIHKDFRYDTTVTDVSTPVDRVFAIRAGVCQDLTHVGLACARALGLAARYVSGYLLTKPPEGRVKLLGADASHAWFAVWCPPFGWVDLDPTNDLIPRDEHVTLAWGRDYADVAPINGVVVGGGDHMIDVGVDVIPI